MSTHKALVLHARDKPLVLETVSLPIASTGDAIVRILAADIVPYMGEVISNKRPYPLSLPMTPGNTAIGRVHEVGPDAVDLTPGQLVFCDITIRARDNPAVSILYGVHGGGYPAAQKLMDGVWRNATYAEYARFPLENLYRLDEASLLRSLRYSINDLCLLPVCLVPFGGLSEVGLKPGEVVIVAPATGRYGGAAVNIALAMGATVIAGGRNITALEKLKSIHATNRLRTVQITGDAAADTELFRAAAGKDGADVYLDLSPPAVQGSSLLTSGIRSLRAFGRCVVMGGNSGHIDFPYLEIMFKSIRIQGRFMYDRRHVLQLIQMVESGLLPLGKKAGVSQTEVFGLEQIEEALQAAGKLSGWGGYVVLKP
ncbi:Putative Catalytic activity: An alcohol NAD() <=_ an aldehyde or ketone NADH [Aspergillus calidoustus]|uniref:Putative Catalytic activity: An alcohol NAD( ) <=> an aldehyde or ketone NADH n=1 Tax=Aspergillus calidoustus TaxID=454130 RepID=A0A0U4ZAY3_ASPCI|nr:Putative Catalytic activity: An alcohol NAD() <=> an aldehyde or ketone NADH [Aspergillus calidoustus]